MAVEDQEGKGRARLTHEQVGALLEAVRDPLILRHQQADLALALPDLTIPEPRDIVDDLREALRLARAGLEQVGPYAARRYRTVELLLNGASMKQAAAAQSISLRTLQRARSEGITELTPLLERMWARRRSERPAADPLPAEGAAGSEGIPAPRVFVGRTEELAQATELLAQTRMLVIGGPAGVGKTTIAAALARQEALLHPVLWHHLRPGLTDSVAGVLFAVGQRLSQLGFDALLTYVRQSIASSPWQVLAQDLAVQGVQIHRLVMVFDGAEAVADNAEVCGLLSLLHTECTASRMVLVSKQRMPLLGDAARLELSGIDVEMVRDYLEAHGLTDLGATAVEVLAQQTGGSPQLLHLATGALLHGELRHGSFTDDLLEVADVQAYFFDHIYRQLSRAEQLVLGAVSLMRSPESTSFLANALNGLVPSIPATLAELGRHYLLTSGTDGMRLHSSIRELARRILPPNERE